MKALTRAAAGLTIIGLLASGCSAANKGGQTTCKDYQALSSSQQTDVIKKYLGDKGKNPSNGEITLTKLAASAFCATVGRDSDPISKIETG